MVVNVQHFSLSQINLASGVGPTAGRFYGINYGGKKYISLEADVSFINNTV
jgi:hypothetical protein